MAQLDGVAWEDLAVLIQAAELRSLSAAAKALQISQSTASRRLMRLEAALGAPVLDRGPRALVLTALGEQLLPHAELIAGHMTDIGRLAAGAEVTPAGRVRLAVPDGVASEVIVPHLDTFFARYPDISVDIVSGQAIVDLVHREADLALRFVRPTAGDLLIREVARVPLAPFCRPALRHHAPQAMRWLMLLDPTSAYLETRWIQAHVQPRRTMVFSSWDTLFAAARAGLGAAILSPVVAAPAGLVPIPELPPVASRPLLMVYHRALRSVPRVAALRDWIVSTLAAL